MLRSWPGKRGFFRCSLMRFKLDENLPVELVAEIRDAGHEVETVYEEGLAGSTDETILRKVREERLVLLTLDKGIADIRAFPPDEYSGIVLFRPLTTGKTATINLVHRRLDNLYRMDLAGRLIVVTESGVRVR